MDLLLLLQILRVKALTEAGNSVTRQVGAFS
jgi:hypothetical protein